MMASTVTGSDETVTKRPAPAVLDEVTGDDVVSSADSSNKRRKTDDGSLTFSDSPTFKEIHEMHQSFIKERNWDQFHPPRNVVLALVGEVGELAECFQWKGEVEEGLPDWSSEEKRHLGEELSDVLLHLMDLAARCHVDLPKAAVEKLRRNAEKYPADKAYGSCKKYTAYQ